MPEFQVVKGREFPDSVKQVAWNKDEKQALLSVVVEGGRDIVLLAPDGEQKQVLSGHAEPVISHAWLLPDTVASVSAEGEVRVWTIRGSRVDCTRIKEKYPDPRGIVALPSAKKTDARFLLWHQDAAIAVFEAARPATLSKALTGKIHVVCALENALLVLRHEQGATIMELLDFNLAGKKAMQVSIDDTPLQAIGLDIDANICGCIVLCKGGSITSCTTKDGKVHVLGQKEEISAIHVEKDTRTLFIGGKSGMVRSVAFRPDLSFIDTIATFEAHEFKITALALERKLLSLAIGGLDGVLKIAHISESCMQKAKLPPPKPGADWKDRERAENKLRQAEEAIDKGETARAAELVDAVRRSPVPGLEQQLTRLETRLRAKAGEQQKAQAIRQKLIEFLDHVAEERGEILLGEISKSMAMPMADVKRWIKALDEEMEWEYIEQQECLILFNRTMSITRETDIERQMTVESDERFRYKRERRQLGQRRPAERRDRYPAPERQSARQRDTRPWYKESSPVDRLDGQEMAILKQIAAGISGKMQASIVGPDLKSIKIVPLSDLISAMETISRPARAIISDGIISPRLVTIAEKAGIRQIVGQRLHPNLDRAAVKVDCIEFHELESKPISPPASGSKQEPHDAAGTSRTDLEGKLLAVFSTTKWQNIEEILSRANIKDEFERNLAAIKLKQLAASGTLVSEVVNKILYFKQAQK